MKVLLVGELMSSSIDANVHSNVAAHEFNVCPVESKSQRYLDSLYRCHPGEMLSMNPCTARVTVFLLLPIDRAAASQKHLNSWRSSVSVSV